MSEHIGDSFRGWIFTREGFVKGRVDLDTSSATPVVEVREDWSVEPGGLLLPAFVNSHSHLADFAAYYRLPEGFLVPDVPGMFGPGGVKHRLLGSLTIQETAEYLRMALEIAQKTGTSMVWDFREGGAEGYRALNMAREGMDIDVFPFVRPTGPEELEEYPDAGVSLSSVRDVDGDFLDALNRARLSRDMPLAIHVSEVSREPIGDVLNLDPQVGVHFSWATHDDLVTAYENGIYPVFCVRSNTAFTTKPPLAWSIDSGIMFGLGTDNAMACSPDMRLEIEAAFKTALGQVRKEGLNTPTIKMAEAILMAATYWPRDIMARMGVSRARPEGVEDVTAVAIVKGNIKRPLMYAMNYMATVPIRTVFGSQSD